MKKNLIWLGIIIFLVGCHLLPNNVVPTLSSTTQSTSENELNTQSVITSDSPAAAIPSLPPNSTVTSTILPTTTPAHTGTITPSLTPTIVPFALQANSPVYIQNFGHSEAKCQWLGVAGQVFDKSDQPMPNLVVAIKGLLNGKKIDMVALTGFPQANIYGPGGYEIVLSDSTSNSVQPLTIQLFDLKGNTLSNVVDFATFQDCTKNLIIINFQYKK